MVDRDVVVAEGPFVGVNKKRLSRDLQFDVAEDALNIDLSRSSLKNRPGFTNVSTATNGQPIEGIHDYVKQDGTNLLLVKAGNQLYKVDRTIQPHIWTTIGSTDLTSGELADMVTALDRVYIAHKGIPKATDGTGLFDWLIDPPTIGLIGPDYIIVEATDPADTVFPAGATFQWKITQYSSAWGLESPSSHVAFGTVNQTLTLTVNAKSVEIRALNGSLDSRVDKARIYRRRVDTNEVDLFLVAEIDKDDAKFVDTVPDASRSLNFTAPLSFDTELPFFTRISWNNDIMLAASSDFPNNLYFSVLGGVTPLGFIASDNEISAIVPWQTVWAVFIRSSIWVLSGNAPENFVFQKTVPTRGCVAPFSTIARDEGIYFASDDSLYLYPLQAPTNVCISMEDDWRSRNTSKDDKVVAFYIPNSNAISWLYAKASASTAPDRMLTYFYDNARVTQSPSWVPWEIPDVTFLKTVRSAVDDSEVTLVGFSDGRLADLSGDLDNETQFSAFWQTSKFDRQHPGRRKKWGKIAADLKKQTILSYVDIDVIFDDESKLERIGHINQATDESFVSRVGGQSSQLRIKLTAQSPFEIHSYSLESKTGVKR